VSNFFFCIDRSSEAAPRPQLSRCCAAAWVCEVVRQQQGTAWLLEMRVLNYLCVKP